MTKLEDQLNLPAEVSEAFSSATVTALRELTQLEAAPQNLRSDMAGPHVVAVMTLHRSAPGSLSLVMSVDTAERLTSCYLQTELTEELVNDVAGEFINVIAGQAKTILKETPYHFLLSLPVVTRSAIVTLQSGVVLNISCDAGPIQLYVSLLPVE